MSVYSHRSAEFSCPHCGKKCDSNTGTANAPDEKSIGICVSCVQPFWLIIISRSPLTFRTEKISASEYEQFSPENKKQISEFQNMLRTRIDRSKDAEQHAAFLEIMATLVKEFQIDFPTIMLMFAYYPLPALDPMTDKMDREFAASMFDRYVELSRGVIEKPFDYMTSMFTGLLQIRNAAEFIFRK